MELTEKEIRQLYNKLHYQKHRTSMIKATVKYFRDNPEYRLYTSAKQRASKKNLEFSISVDDIIIPKTCKYLGIELTNIAGQGRLQSNVSLDRIDPTKGYTKDNIEVISDLANRMKQDASKEQLLCFAKNIIKSYQ